MWFNLTGGFSDRYDYRPRPRYITIPAGTTNMSFSVKIYDDHTIESNEMFEMDISSSPSYIYNFAHYGSINNTTVTIVDEKSMYLQYLYI